MHDQPLDYEAVEAEMHQLLANLKGASPEVIDAETKRLQAMAERVQDERGRERARFRAGSLPRLLAEPAPATSPQFHQAQALFAQAVNSEEPAQVRIPQIQRTISEIGALVGPSSA